MRSRFLSGSPFALLLAPLPALLLVGGCEDITITVVDVMQVEVQPAQVELVVGDSLHLTAVLRDQSGNVLHGRPVGWTTGDPSVAEVSAEGVVLAQTPGVVPIKASVAGVEGMANIRVLSPARIVVPTHLHFVGQVGAPDPAAQLLPIVNAGEWPLSDLSLAIVSFGGGPSDWLRAGLQPFAGGIAALLTVQHSGLPPGSYAARLRISSPHAENSPVDVDVDLYLEEPTPYSSIQLSATTLGFPWDAGQAPPPMVTVDVWNGGTGVLEGLGLSIRYETGQPAGWLDARLTLPSAPTEMEIAATPGTLPNGTYTAWIVLSSPGAINSPRELRVRLTIGDPAPQLLLSPDRLELFGVAGETSVQSGFARVSNATEGPLSGLSVGIEYALGEPVAWLTAALAESVAPTDLTVGANAGGLAVGTHRAAVWVEGAGALNSPRWLDVVFHVGAAVSAARSVIESSPTTLIADGVSTATITVHLRDPGGTPLSSGGHQVALSTTAGHLGQITDRLDGTYQATLTAPTTVGVAAITGELGGNAIGEAATVTFLAGAASAEHSTLTVRALEAVQALDSHAGEEHNFRVLAELRDRWENPLGRGGDQVAFSSSQGDLGPVEDHENGTYSAILSTSGEVGTFTVTGTVNGIEMAEGETVEPPANDDPPGDDPPEDEPPGDDPPEDDPPADEPPEDDPPGDDPPPVDPTTASVREISYGTTGGGNSNRHLHVALTVVDGLGDPLRSASVAIELANTDTGQTWNYSAVSGHEGDVTFSLNNHPVGCYVTRVVSLSAAGYNWDGETPSNGVCRASGTTSVEAWSFP